jgi:hypothetical protein
LTRRERIVKMRLFAMRSFLLMAKVNLSRRGYLET